MKLGLIVPLFRDSPAPALEMADRAEGAGLDGVFVFDHLWPIGKQSGPALSAFPVLGAIAARTSHIRVGTLVARAGVVDNAVLVREFETVAGIAGPRLIAGLGVGDATSKPENAEYGVAFPSLVERLLLLDEACRQLRHRSITVWIGGKSARVRQVAEANGVTANLWHGTPGEVADSTDATWAGYARGSVDEVTRSFARLREAGYTWAVALVPGSGADPVAAVETLAGVRARLT